MSFSVLRPPLVGIGRTPIERALLTLSGNEITDAVRTTGTEGDGETPPAGVGIWPAATNLFTNGGLESDSSEWFTGTSFSNRNIERVEEYPKFGSWSMRTTISGAVAAFGAMSRISFTFPSAGTYTVSVWVRASGGFDGGSFQVTSSDYAGSSIVSTATANAVDGEYVRISQTRTIDAGDLAGTWLVQSIGASSTGVVHVDGFQIETGSIATPYIETDGGTAARSAGRVQLPVSGLFTETQGWVAGATTFPIANTAISTGIAVLWEWYDDADNYLRIAYDWANNRVSFIRRSAGSQTESTVSATFAAGETLTWGADWTASAIAAIADGTRATPSADTNIPTLSAASSDIGSAAGSASFLNGNDRHVESGSGTLTDADAARLHGIGDTLPGIDRVRQAVSGKALVTSAWRARNGSFERLAA